jgi:hypothetical protein
MENGVETNLPEEINELHDQLVDQAAAGTEQTHSGMEKSGDQSRGDSGDDTVNPDFCASILATICSWHAKAVKAEFISDLEPIAGRDQAARIAERAAMSPTTQAAISTHGSRVLCKYGIGQFVNDESVLIAAIATYAMELSAARKDRDKILAKHRSEKLQSENELRKN